MKKIIFTIASLALTLPTVTIGHSPSINSVNALSSDSTLSNEHIRQSELKLAYSKQTNLDYPDPYQGENVKLLIGITPSVTGNTQQLADDVLERANSIFKNSHITTTDKIVLAGIYHLNYDSSDYRSLLPTIVNDGESAGSFMDDYAADLMIVITGLADPEGIKGYADDDTGYAISFQATALNERNTFTHELGHLFGAGHDKTNPMNSYNHAFVFNNTQTIMGDLPINVYSSLPLFSSPAEWGTPKHNNRRAIIEAFPNVASKRNGDVAIMLPPTNLQATILSSSSVLLSWSDNTDLNTGYRIYQDGNLLAQIAQDITSYQVNNLAHGQAYQFRVDAYNATQSASSNTITVLPNQVEINYTGSGSATHAMPGQLKSYIANIDGSEVMSIQWFYQFSAFENGDWILIHDDILGSSNNQFSQVFKYTQSYGTITLKCRVTFESGDVVEDSLSIEWDNLF